MTPALRWRIFYAACFLAVLALATCDRSHAETMIASFYGAESGRQTASGERFRPSGLTAAHRTLPFGTLLRVTYQGRSVVVRISDRGPAKWTKRDLDISQGAARVIGMTKVGVARVEVEIQK